MSILQVRHDEVIGDFIEIPDYHYLTQEEFRVEMSSVRNGVRDDMRRALNSLMLSFLSSLSELIEERAGIVIEPDEIYKLYQESFRHVPA